MVKALYIPTESGEFKKGDKLVMSYSQKIGKDVSKKAKLK